MNGYVRLSALQRDLAGVTSDALITELLTLRDEVSREFDRETRRFFHGRIETAHFSGAGCRELWLGRDLISITTLKVSATADQPTTFDYTLAAGTDYTLWPRNAAAEGKPYRKIILNPAGQLSAFPLGVDNVELVGKFGYSETWQASGLTGTLSDATDTSLTANLTAAGIIDPGDVLQIESEEVEVTAVNTVTLTVVRGRNGTTAAGHTAAALSIRRYPEDVENAVKERTVGRRWDAQGGYSAGLTLSGDSMSAAGQTTGRGIYSRWRDACRDYTNPAAVL